MYELTQVRRDFAESLRRTARLRSDALVDAFATVPREVFLGPPPWLVWDPKVTASVPSGRIPYVPTDDPRRLYADVLVALDADHGINNGQPSLWANIYDRFDAKRGERIVHIGCGVGYYTAILAELAGSSGSVVGLDIDRTLLARARQSLAAWPNVEIKERSGADYEEGPADIIVVNAGITHLLGVWLDALKPNGRLIVPLTSDSPRPEAGYGAFFAITRTDGGYRAQFLCPTAIFHFAGARIAEAGARVQSAFQTKGHLVLKVSSLRRDTHHQDETCWLHGEGYCLSLGPAATPH